VAVSFFLALSKRREQKSSGKIRSNWPIRDPDYVGIVSNFHKWSGERIELKGTRVEWGEKHNFDWIFDLIRTDDE
jgi:hypothetical protein